MHSPPPCPAFIGLPAAAALPAGARSARRARASPAVPRRAPQRRGTTCVAAGVPCPDGFGAASAASAASATSTSPGNGGAPDDVKWETIAGCSVALPAHEAPRAVVHFLGGLGAGSAPARFYGALAAATASRARVAVVCAPLPTLPGLDHAELARDAAASVGAAVADLRARFGFLHTVAAGHSLGARLQVVRACAAPQGGVVDAGMILLCFNNFSAARAARGVEAVADAVAGAVGEDAARVAQGAVAGLGVALEGAGDVVAGLGRVFGEFASEFAGGAEVQRQVQEVAQRSKEFAERARGFRPGAEFSPSPTELLDAVRERYSVACTMVVSFERDSLDCSDEVADAIRDKFGEGAVVRRKLQGTHVTPLTPDLAGEMRNTGNEMFDRGIDVVAAKARQEFDDMVICVAAFVRFVLEEKVGRRRIPGGS